MAIRVFIVDDHRLFREGLRRLIEDEEDIEVVAEAGEGRSALERLEDVSPDVILMDLSMPELNGIEATHRIVQGSCDAQVVAVSMYGDRDTIISAIEAGAVGFVLKHCEGEELLEALRAAGRGKSYLCSEASKTLVKSLQDRDMDTNGMVARKELTPREREVLQLIAEGNTSKDIAARLGISLKTVQSHRNNIMEKLDLHSVADLTRYAIAKGMVSADSIIDKNS